MEILMKCSQRKKQAKESDDEWSIRHGIAPNSYNPHCWIVGEPKIGKGTWIGAFCVIDGFEHVCL